MFQVYFHRARLDPQIVGDVTITQALLDQTRDLDFTWRQLGPPLMREPLAIGEDAILQPGIPVGDRPQTGQQSFRCGSPPQDSARARLKKSQGFRFIDPAAPDDDGGF